MAAETKAKNVRLEALQAGHVPAVLEIESQSNGAPWSEQSFLNELKNPQSLFKVAIANGEIAGYGGVWKIVDEAHVTTVAVAPKYRRQGIARRIMVELLEDAKSEGILCATLEVRAGNVAAQALYESLGFAAVATRKNYYPDNREDATIMWLYDLGQWTPARR